MTCTDVSRAQNSSVITALELHRGSLDGALADPPDLLHSHLLGSAIYGGGRLVGVQPCARVAMPQLPALDDSSYAWLAPGPFVSGGIQGLRYRYNDHLLFGVIELREDEFPATEEISALQRVSQVAYDRVFATLAHTGFRNLARCWNYLPRINVDGGGMERYRQFNIGRQDAFISGHRSHLTGSPAACALGTSEGELVVYFIASHAHPLNIENPRQVSAYRYPKRYGPRSPTFSRASLLPLPGREVLFISGTASIVGHESVHLGDVVAQTEETVRNLEAVVEQANLKSRQGGFAVRDLDLKVFIRHPEDLDAVTKTLHVLLGDDLAATYLLADVCREELLVEIEATGFVDVVSA